VRPAISFFHKLKNFNMCCGTLLSLCPSCTILQMKRIHLHSQVMTMKTLLYSLCLAYFLESNLSPADLNWFGTFVLCHNSWLSLYFSADSKIWKRIKGIAIQWNNDVNMSFMPPKILTDESHVLTVPQNVLLKLRNIFHQWSPDAPFSALCIYAYCL